MSSHELRDAESMPEGSSRLYHIDGHKYLVYRLSDGYYATGHQCTHLFKSLEKGVIVSDRLVRCPLHRAEFDIRSGQVEQWACFPPGVQLLNVIRSEKALPVYRVTEENGKILLHT
ncbi:MAG TPA: Rieske 2Fe-2S domain-containing protein [Pseudomonadales bacterium]